MKITVIFSKMLHEYTKVSSTSLEVYSYLDIISALYNLFPDLSKRFMELSLDKCLTVLDGAKIVRSYEKHFSPKQSEIYIVPTLSGGVSNDFDSLGNLNLFYGSSGAVSSQVADLSTLHKRIRDSSLFGKSATAFDIAQRASNRASGILDNSEDPTRGFGGLSSMAAQGQAIPIHFGLVRTSGAVISQNIKHIQRGGIDTVRVADYL
jgi:predicted phage tail protein